MGKKYTSQNDVKNMKNEYRASKQKIIIYAIVIISVIIFLIGVTVYVSITETDKRGMPVFIGMLIAIIGSLIFALISIMKYRIEVNLDGIIETGIIRSRVIKFNEIESYTIQKSFGSFNLELVIKNNYKKNKTTISVPDAIGRDLPLLLSSISRDTNELELEESSKKVIEENREYDSETLTLKISRAKKETKVLTVFSSLLLIWCIYKPIPYHGLMWLIIALPIIAIILMYRHKGLIVVGSSKNSPLPSIEYPIILPALGLAWRAYFDWNIIEYKNVYIPIVLISTSLSLLIVKSYRKSISKIVVASIVGYSLIYGYGATINLNGLLDKGTVKHYQSKVVDCEVSYGSKSTTYYLIVKPWIDGSHSMKVPVSKQLYEIINRNDMIEINTREGFFSIPWYYIKKAI